jgi:hypothetical protein
MLNTSEISLPVIRAKVEESSKVKINSYREWLYELSIKNGLQGKNCGNFA